MAEDLPIVFEDYPPYEYFEDGEIKGVNMDLIREAFSRMGVTVYFEPRPWKRAIYQLKTGEILALSSGFRTPEREKFGVFPDSPLAEETNVMMALKGRDVEIEFIDDLHNYTIGVVSSYVYGKAFDDLVGLKKKEVQSTHQLVKMLLNRRVDVVVGSQEVLRHLLRKQEKLDQVEVLYKLNSEPLYLFFSRARGQEAESLARRFSKAIKAMKRDGTFDAIKSRY